MEIAASNIVRSVAGRDQGKLFIVLAVEGEYLLLADGKSRKVESPKRKKRWTLGFSPLTVTRPSLMAFFNDERVLSVSCVKK